MRIMMQPRQDMRSISSAPALTRASGAEDVSGRLSPAPTFRAALRAAADAGQPFSAARRAEALAASSADGANGVDGVDAAYGAGGLAAAGMLAGEAARAATAVADAPETIAADAAGGLDPRAERWLPRFDAREREEFLDAAARRQSAYLDWKERSDGVRQAAEEFAGFFFGFMMKEMRGTVAQGELGHGGKGEQVFQELLDEEVGNRLAQGGDRTGLVDTLQHSLSGPAPYLGARAYQQHQMPEPGRAAAAAEAARLLVPLATVA